MKEKNIEKSKKPLVLRSHRSEWSHIGPKVLTEVTKFHTGQNEPTQVPTIPKTIIVKISLFYFLMAPQGDFNASGILYLSTLFNNKV